MRSRETRSFSPANPGSQIPRLVRIVHLGYSVDLAPAIDPIDIGINSVQTLIDLRDLKLARAE